MPKPFIASRVYMKPLLPGELPDEGDITNVLRRSKTDLLRRVKRELMQETFSDRAKRALAKSIKIVVKPSSLQITASHPAFGPLVRGQKSEQMRWLTKARKPIPIVTETGEVIFRSATAKSMADGKWIHPGRRPSDFVDKAKQESRAFLKDKFRKELRRRVRAAVG
jgi:hypothetical protein